MESLVNHVVEAPGAWNFLFVKVRAAGTREWGGLMCKGRLLSACCWVVVRGASCVFAGVRRGERVSGGWLRG